MAKQVVEYLKANPEAAQQSYEQAHRMLQTPGMAQIMVEAKVRDSRRDCILEAPPAVPTSQTGSVTSACTSQTADIPLMLSSAYCVL